MNLLFKSLLLAGILGFGGYGTYRVADIYELTGDSKRVVLVDKNSESDTTKEGADSDSKNAKDLNSSENKLSVNSEPQINAANDNSGETQTEIKSTKDPSSDTAEDSTKKLESNIPSNPTQEIVVTADSDNVNMPSETEPAKTDNLAI